MAGENEIVRYVSVTLPGAGPWETEDQRPEYELRLRVVRQYEGLKPQQLSYKLKRQPGEYEPDSGATAIHGKGSPLEVATAIGKITYRESEQVLIEAVDEFILNIVDPFDGSWERDLTTLVAGILSVFRREMGNKQFLAYCHEIARVHCELNDQQKTEA